MAPIHFENEEVAVFRLKEQWVSYQKIKDGNLAYVTAHQWNLGQVF